MPSTHTPFRIGGEVFVGHPCSNLDPYLSDQSLYIRKLGPDLNKDVPQRPLLLLF
jgi:hypothetical protein